METIHAIFENGVFRPLVPIQLPEHSEVAFEPRLLNGESKQDLKGVFAIMDERFDTGEHDLAARIDELQP